MFFLRSKLRPRPKQRSTSSKTSRRFATVSQEQNKEFLAEKSKRNSRRILVFSLFCTYALLAVLGTSDYDLLLKQPIEIPGLRITLPLLTFYFVTPLAILALHFGVLWMHDRYLKELQNIPRAMIEEIPFSILDAPHLDASSLVRWSVNFLVYLFPLLVLTVFFFHFAKYQSSGLSFWHLLCLNIDLLFILHFAHPTKDRIFKLFGALFSLVLFLIFTFFCSFFIYPSHLLAIKQIKFLHPLLPHLKVTHCNLNKGFDLNEAKAYRELDDEKEKRPYLFYTTMVDLRNRKLVLADLSYSKMVNFDLTGADLRGASLLDNQLQNSCIALSNLQGAKLWGANLQGTDLQRANLQRAMLVEANLQGAVLLDAKLQGAFLVNANLQGAVLLDAKLQGARLIGTNLQGAFLIGTNLQGAFLVHANLQGAYMDGTNLQGAYAGKDFKGFLDFIGKPTQLSRLGSKKFTQEDSQRIVKTIKSKPIYTLLDKSTIRKWIALVKQAVGKSSLEWLEMQKGQYVTGVLTWKEACEIQRQVDGPHVRKFMGLDEVNWEEKCK